jgi:hypothetical protein
MNNYVHFILNGHNSPIRFYIQFFLIPLLILYISPTCLSCIFFAETLVAGDAPRCCQRGKLFYRLMQQAVTMAPLSFEQIARKI